MPVAAHTSVGCARASAAHAATRSGVRPAISCRISPRRSNFKVTLNRASANKAAARMGAAACAVPAPAPVEVRASAAQESMQLLRRLVRASGGCHGHADGCRTLLDHAPPRTLASAVPSAVGPRVYVYTCMDALHRSLLRSAPTAEFFDIDLPRSQFLTEFALHRATLASPWRTLEPAHADLYFVPSYARLSYPGDKAAGAQRAQHARFTSALASCLGRSPHWLRSNGTDHVAVLSSTRDPGRLFGPAWPMLRDGLLLRVEGADRRHAKRGLVSAARHVIMPYFVPHFAEDDAASADRKARKKARRHLSVRATRSMRRATWTPPRQQSGVAVPRTARRARRLGSIEPSSRARAGMRELEGTRSSSRWLRPPNDADAAEQPRRVAG